MEKKRNFADAKLCREWWDKIAKPADQYERRGKYVDAFLKLSGVKYGDTVFDMGCGSGTLDLPLADEGISVFCADYSKGMLNSLQNIIEKEKLTGLTTCLLAWEDNWENKNLPVCTMAFSSRSMVDVKPEDAVRKLNSRALKRVCFTVPVNAGMFQREGSPYNLGSQEDMEAYLEACLAAVRELGFEPQVSYIYDSKGKGEKHWAFVSFDK